METKGYWLDPNAFLSKLTAGEREEFLIDLYLDSVFGSEDDDLSEDDGFRWT